MGCGRMVYWERMDCKPPPHFLPHPKAFTRVNQTNHSPPQVLLLPTMFQHINEKVFYIFGAVNFLTIPIVWAFYPESNQRTLEEMDLLFATNSWWNWDAESTFARLREENPELVQAARRTGSVGVGDPEIGGGGRVLGGRVWWWG